MKGDIIHCLDHGFVRLVDYMGEDLSITRAARVSYNEEWKAGEDAGSDARLINYLKKHDHNTPFESVVFTFEVKAPIFIFRQWHRHRTWTYNELSARYRELPEEFYLPMPEMIGQQSAKSKQARDIGLVMTGAELDNRRHEVSLLKEACENAFTTYRSLLSAGWPRELARSVLPVNTYSHMFATVNLLNLMRFLTLRDHSHAQHEIQVYALALKELARTVVPVAIDAWEKTRETE